MKPGNLSRFDQALADLSRHDSEAERTARLRSRCHALLERAASPLPDAKRRHTRIAESAVVGAFCFAYLYAVVITALTREGAL